MQQQPQWWRPARVTPLGWTAGHWHNEQTQAFLLALPVTRYLAWSRKLSRL